VLRACRSTHTISTEENAQRLPLGPHTAFLSGCSAIFYQYTSAHCAYYRDACAACIVHQALWRTGQCAPIQLSAHLSARYHIHAQALYTRSQL